MADVGRAADSGVVTARAEGAGIGGRTGSRESGDAMNDDAPVTERMCRERSLHNHDILKDIKGDVERLVKTIERSNGKPSLLSRTERLEWVLGLMVWSVSITAGAALVTVIGIVVTRIASRLMGAEP